MDTTYDIFRRLTDAGPPLWVETVISLEQAKQRLAVLSSLAPGAYMIYDLRLGMFIEPAEISASRPLPTNLATFSIVRN
jgi:hypothetical protein